jgi:hypothetical protein
MVGERGPEPGKQALESNEIPLCVLDACITAIIRGHWERLFPEPAIVLLLSSIVDRTLVERPARLQFLHEVAPSLPLAYSNSFP